MYYIQHDINDRASKNINHSKKNNTVDQLLLSYSECFLQEQAIVNTPGMEQVL